MNKSIVIISFWFSNSTCFGQKRQSLTSNLKQKIDNHLKKKILINEIPRSAVAVIQNGKVVSEQYYGTS